MPKPYGSHNLIGPSLSDEPDLASAVWPAALLSIDAALTQTVGDAVEAAKADPDILVVDDLFNPGSIRDALDGRYVSTATVGPLDGDDLAFAVTDDVGQRTWIEADSTGAPSDYAVQLLKAAGVGGGIEQAEQVPAVAVADAEGQRTWLESDWKGNPTAYAVERMAEAGVGVDSTPATEYIDGTGATTPIISTTDEGVVAWGDSTTYGADLSSPDREAYRWTKVLADKTGWAIENMGASGSRAEEITARIGGVVPTATVQGGTIPASGSCTLTDFDIDPLRVERPHTLKVDLRTPDGTIIRGTLAAQTYAFTRQDTGPAVTVDSSRVELFSVEGSSRKNKLIFLGQGINNEPLITSNTPTQTVEDVKRWYTDAITALGPLQPRFVIWGVLDRGPAEAPGTKTYDRLIGPLETWLEQRFGIYYAPVRHYLISPQALIDAAVIHPSFTPTQDDLDAQALGTTPPAFRVNSVTVHLNVLGHALQARYLERHLRSPKIGWLPA